MSDQPGTDDAHEETPEGAATEEKTGGSEKPEWLDAIESRMSELGDSTGRMAEQLAELYGAPEEEPEEEFSDGDLYDDDGELTPEGAQKLIDQRVDERLEARLSKRDAARALEEREDAFDALREEVPALQDDKLAARLVRETAEWCQRSGNERLINTPEFVDLVEDRYYRESYHERAAAEREDREDREVVLESASGASQPSSKKEPDWGDRIVKAAQRLRPDI